MREIQEIIIDDKTYAFSQMMTTKSLKILSKLTKLLGEPMMMALSSVFKGATSKEDFAKSILEKKIDTAQLAEAVKMLLARMDEDEVIGVIKDLSTDGVLCNGAKVMFETHYAGELMHLSKVVQAALSVQYGNFFGVILDAMPAVKMTQTAMRKV